MSKELWRNINGYKGMYQVSSFGRIRSYKYSKCRILKQRINQRGYKYINLCNNGKYKSFKVHRLVAIAFIGNSKLTVNHKNGNKLNNTINNLEYLTVLDNIKHAKLNNLIPTGEKSGGSKLKQRDVELIRYKYSKGKSIKCLTKEFYMSKNAISKIVQNITWKKIN